MMRGQDLLKQWQLFLQTEVKNYFNSIKKKKKYIQLNIEITLKAIQKIEINYLKMNCIYWKKFQQQMKLIVNI